MIHKSERRTATTKAVRETEAEAIALKPKPEFEIQKSQDEMAVAS